MMEIIYISKNKKHTIELKTRIIIKKKKEESLKLTKYLKNTERFISLSVPIIFQNKDIIETALNT